MATAKFNYSEKEVIKKEIIKIKDSVTLTLSLAEAVVLINILGNGITGGNHTAAIHSDSIWKTLSKDLQLICLPKKCLCNDGDFNTIHFHDESLQAINNYVKGLKCQE